MAKLGDVRRDVVHCENCGEDYSITYKRCPFCNAKPGQIDPDREDDRYDETYDEGDHRYEETPYGGRKGGKRLSSAPEEDRRGDGGGRGHGGGGRVALNVVGLVVSLALIAAAVLIIVTQVVPKFKKNPPVVTPPVEAVTPSPTPAATATPAVTPAPSDSGAPALPDPSGSPLPADPAATPVVTPAVSQAPAPTGLRLSSTDFTLDTKYPSYQMSTSGGTGGVTWASGNTAVATVTVGGLVRGVASGNCTVTATDAAGNTAKCIVRVNLPETAPSAPPAESPAPGETQTPAPTEAPKPAAKAKLSSTDFTLSKAYGMSHRLTVSGGTASAWSSSNEAVATVSQDGTVTGLADGNCTVTATLADGGTLKCVVRVAK